MSLSTNPKKRNLYMAWRETLPEARMFQVGDRVIFRKPPEGYAKRLLYEEGDRGTVLRHYGTIVVVQNDHDGREWALSPGQLDPLTEGESNANTTAGGIP